MKPLGDMVKAVISPFVKGTSLENCSTCEKRRLWLNKVSTRLADLVTTITCPCAYKRIYARFRKS